MSETIAAIATPPGVGGVGIVRISGADALLAAERVFTAQNGTPISRQKSHTAAFGTICHPQTGQLLDEALALVMLAPHSYTTENVVELQCHGGPLVVQSVLDAVLQSGARLAEPGEFTKRAFLNGRMDLSQAEAVIGLIHAQTETAQRAALGQLQGRLRSTVERLRDTLLDLIAGIEAAIDYPEYELERETRTDLLTGVQQVLTELTALYNASSRGQVLAEGLHTVILGRPNVGKSSLLNLLLQEERAIVTDIPGTTRDTVEATLNLGGIPLHLVDTAGIRQTEHTIEQMGVEKSKAYAERADLLFVVLDRSLPLSEEDRQILALAKNRPVLLLCNKSDLPPSLSVNSLLDYAPAENILTFSAKTGEGVTALTDRVRTLFLGGEATQAEFLGNLRQRNALLEAKTVLERTLAAIEGGMGEDFISIDLQEANTHLGEITGDTVDDEIIDRIFTRFCLGK